MNMSIKNDFIKLFKSFGFAFKGIIYCIKSERNMRIHLCAAFYVLLIMPFFELEKSERAVIYIVISLVIALEMINTAVEAAVDLKTKERDSLAGIAKDCAAGAVLCSAIVSVVIAVVFFADADGWTRLFEYFADSPLKLVLLVLSAVFWFVFIFVIGKGKKNEQD